MGLLGTRQALPPVWLFVLLGAIVVPGFAFATFQVWSNDIALRDRGQDASAVVVRVGSGSRSRVHVEFTTQDGRRVETLVGQGDEAPGPRAQPGDEIPIRYDPQNPTSEVRDTRAPENHHLAYLLLGTTVFGAVGMPLAAWHLAREHRRRRMTGGH
jgi:hypothetical protein